MSNAERRSRVLLVATTTGYQTRAFDEAADALGVSLTLATDRCDVLDDPWRDRAIPVRFHEPAAAEDAIAGYAAQQPFTGVLAVGDRPAALAARLAAVLGLPGHPPSAAAAAGNKLLTRERLHQARLPVPGFVEVPLAVDPAAVMSAMDFPVVVKPLALSASRGVMRANNPRELRQAFERLRTLLASPDVKRERDRNHDRALIERFISGREYAVEGVMSSGVLQVLAIFDKPDPLDGPFFEETLYVTPTRLSAPVQSAIVDAIARAVRAIGLKHGPIHAECRVGEDAVWVLEVAARPIGGLCARALRFVASGGSNDGRSFVTLEELLLRHAIGETTDGWVREPSASGVMMIPIPRRGVLRSVRGEDEARAVTGVEDVRITAKPDQVLVPLPEGSSYLGFIFARGSDAAGVEASLRAAHGRLSFTIAPEVRVLQSAHG